MTRTIKFLPVLFIAMLFLAPLSVRADTQVYSIDLPGGYIYTSQMITIAQEISNAMTTYGVNTATPYPFSPCGYIMSCNTYGGVSVTGTTGAIESGGMGSGYIRIAAGTGAYFTFDGVNVGSTVTIEEGPWPVSGASLYTGYEVQTFDTTYPCDGCGAQYTPVGPDPLFHWSKETVAPHNTLALWTTGPVIPTPSRSISVSPNTVSYNGSAVLTMTSTDATSCTLGYNDDSGVFQTSAITPNTTVTQSTGALIKDRKYYFQCVNSVYTLSWQEVTVTVGPAPAVIVEPVVSVEPVVPTNSGITCSASQSCAPNQFAACSLTSTANACGKTITHDSGSIQCDGTCAGTPPAAPSNAACPSPSGLLTLPPSCTIAVGKSTCSVYATWTTENTTDPKLVDVNQNGNGVLPYSNVENQAAPGLQVWVAYPKTVFELRNGNTMLSTKTAKADCITGSAWDTNSGTCVATNVTIGTGCTTSGPPCCAP